MMQLFLQHFELLLV